MAFAEGILSAWLFPLKCRAFERNEQCFFGNHFTIEFSYTKIGPFSKFIFGFSVLLLRRIA